MSLEPLLHLRPQERVCVAVSDAGPRPAGGAGAPETSQLRSLFSKPTSGGAGGGQFSTSPPVPTEPPGAGSEPWSFPGSTFCSSRCFTAVTSLCPPTTLPGGDCYSHFIDEEPDPERSGNGPLVTS